MAVGDIPWNVFKDNVASRLGQPVDLVDVSAYPLPRTFPSYIITCQTGAKLVRLLCKYGSDYTADNVYSHKGGVPYEAAIYRDILDSSGYSTPKYYGSQADGNTGYTWLLIEFIENSRTVSTETIRDAAGWIAHFHSLTAARVRDEPLDSVIRYDFEYYACWARRTKQYAQNLTQSSSWLEAICERFEGAIEPLLIGEPALIHGEYTKRNILVQGGVIRPIDWESAAVGAPEIDLAMLTDGRPEGLRRLCDTEYFHRRWPHDAPHSAGQRLAIARIYVHFRWLGQRQDWTAGGPWRFDALRRLGQEIGWL